MQYDGYPRKCMYKGVCTYVYPWGKAVSYEPTTGGKGKSERAGCLPGMACMAAVWV